MSRIPRLSLMIPSYHVTYTDKQDRKGAYRAQPQTAESGGQERLSDARQVEGIDERKIKRNATIVHGMYYLYARPTSSRARSPFPRLLQP